MADLKDQLRKSGLVSDKRAKQAAHEERSRKKKLGRDAAAREKEQQETERRLKERERREADRQREQQRQQREAEAQQHHRLLQLVEANAMRSGVRGPRRFHFVTRERSIPFLTLNDQPSCSSGATRRSASCRTATRRSSSSFRARPRTGFAVSPRS